MGCGNVLNQVEDLGNYPAEGVFNDKQIVNAYLASIYNNSFGGWPVNNGNLADETGGIIADGYLTPSNGTFKFWPYSTIRKINILLAEMENSILETEDKNDAIGQAKFVRAYLYYNMVLYYGGVPILEEPQELTDDLLVSRNSTAECFAFIESDLDDAIALLADRNVGDDLGKIDKSIALAFKGKVLLLKASPQFNPDNPYDNSYWSNAYEANKEAIDFLENQGFGLLSNYVDVFETDGNNEVIFPVIYSDPVKTNGRREDAVRPLSESKNATGGDQPIWQFAEAHTMLDGKMPGESKYNYSETNFWENRDPRFEYNLVWNGAIYPLSGKTSRRQYTMANVALSVDAFANVVQGESHYRTGLFCRKGIDESLATELVTTNDYDWPEIRFAEVLFNFAEAANETGRSEEAIEVVKRIRERAGIEAGDDNSYGIGSGLSREETRELILHEKYIEMSFEGFRFFDLRRHRMLDKLDGMRKYGVMAVKVNGRSQEEVTPDDIALANTYQLLPEDFEYNIVELITNGPKEMVMPESYYFFPIALSEIERNPNLEQNIGWEGGSFDPTL
ncbi:hypothetical protein GCM10025777_30700 [Membranihabitans marinus]